jgi:hypothetical protein
LPLPATVSARPALHRRRHKSRFETIPTCHATALLGITAPGLRGSQHAGTAAGARYVAGTSNVLLFVRELQDQANGAAEAYTFLGRATLESWHGERPMKVVWRLAHPMPGALYVHATLVAG